MSRSLDGSHACGSRSTDRFELFPARLALVLLAIDHVQLAMPSGTDAIEAARAFYVGILGLAEVDRPAALAARPGLWFESGPVKVHLGVEPDFRPARKAHPAFVVEDLSGLLVRCHAAKHRVVAAEAMAGSARAHVDDPFGNRIELIAKP